MKKDRISFENFGSLGVHLLGLSGDLAYQLFEGRKNGHVRVPQPIDDVFINGNVD